MGLVIAGERSGVGKTTVTLALLAALDQGVQSFKVGPDYIDPMFHQAVTGRPCYNLDPVLTSAAYVQRCYQRYSQTAPYALVEGVMGLFDGAGGYQDWGSTADVARSLQLPVLLVIDASRLSHSVAAIVQGYRTLDARLQFAGVVLNRVASDRHLDLLKAAIAPLNVPILGFLRRHQNIELPSRHLGLVPTAELPTLRQTLAQLATLGKTCFDWPRLTPLLRSPVTTQVRLPEAQFQPIPVRLAVARDRAFSFYYAENLALLEALGAQLINWSPLSDPKLPEDSQGLYLGGGFPELFAAELAANGAALLTVKTALAQQLPVYAECGGLMYLCQQLQDFEQRPWPMVGSLPAAVQMSARLTLGYRQATVCQSTPLLAAGTQIWGHEFHRSVIQPAPVDPIYSLQGHGLSNPVLEGWRHHQIHASYLHLHWGDRPEIPYRFLQACQQFGRS
ncbi:cobyrinate a,c-diamide synthase [Almyronema epifaneia]|uniref:Cobyrinate a,c-diamide synthase n=1 Tax=Almyronema epifaneia S1 TaxID=2991925 RepID=A0ABW6IBA4_9CYAN